MALMTLAEAEERLKGCLREGGGLYSLLQWYLRDRPGDKSACLDEEFTADDLEAIAVIMRHHEADLWVSR